jgi:hypothetical protein
VLEAVGRVTIASGARAALLAVTVLGPYHLMSNLVTHRLVPELRTPLGSPAGDSALDAVVLLGRLGAWAVVLPVLGLVVHVLVAAAVVALALQADRRAPPDVRGALRVAVAHSGGAIGGTVLALLAAVVAVVVVAPVLSLAAAVPGGGLLLAAVVAPLGHGVLAGLFTLVVPVAVAEDRGAWTTFVAAVTVVRRRWVRVVTVTLLVTVLLVLVSLAVSLPLWLVSVVAGPLGWAVEAVTATVVSGLVVLVAVATGLVVLSDARAR